MMKKLLKDKKGETLVETLAAILIFTMASIALYSMVTTAAGINREAKADDLSYQLQMDVAERAETPAASGTVTLTLYKQKPGGSTEEMEVGSPAVNVYRHETPNSYFSYFKAP